MLPDLVHGFNDNISKLRTMCLNNLIKLQCFQFFACVEGGGTKNKNIENSVINPYKSF